MNFARRLSLRFVLVAAVSGLFGFGTALLGVRVIIRHALASGVRDVVRKGGCDRAPASFRFDGPGDLVAFAYDPATLRSSNPSAPPLDTRLLEDLGHSPDATVWGESRLGFAGRILTRAGPSGPCAVVQLNYSGRILVPIAAPVITAATAAAVLVSVALGLALVVWPLGRRVRGLESAASRLGLLEPSGPTGTTPGDELDVALASLEAAHTRIRADEARLEERSRALERHLGDVAHDIRTPLLALQLSVEQASDAASTGEVRELLAAALRDSVYLAGLAENLRMKSLLEDSWSPRLTPTDLGNAVFSICLRATSLGKRRGIELGFVVPEVPLTALCDPLAFERVVTNLVDNAVAYGFRGGHVAVTLSATGGEFRVVVDDDGPGVSAEDLRRITERLFRSDQARSRDPRGSGLGLSITAQLCAASGWKLSFSPLSPSGLSVVVTGTLSPLCSTDVGDRAEG